MFYKLFLNLQIFQHLKYYGINIFLLYVNTLQAHGITHLLRIHSLNEHVNNTKS